MRNIFQKLKKRMGGVRRRDGISMAIVICIGALLLSFSLAMAYTGSLMMANANTRLEKERAYQLSKSLAKVLDEQLRGSTKVDSSTPDFYNFAYNFIGSGVYRDYNENNTEKTIYTYHLSSDLSKNYGSSVIVKMYKELIYENTETVLTSDDSGTESIRYQNTLREEEKKSRNRYDLTVVVDVTYGGSEYAYKTVYNCWEQMELKLTGDDGIALYYDENYIIYTDQSYSTPYTGTNVYYTLRTESDHVTSRSFTPATEEK